MNQASEVVGSLDLCQVMWCSRDGSVVCSNCYQEKMSGSYTVQLTLG